MELCFEAMHICWALFLGINYQQLLKIYALCNRDKSQKIYSMTGIKGPTLFLSLLSDRIMLKFGMHKENSRN